MANNRQTDPLEAAKQGVQPRTHAVQPTPDVIAAPPRGPSQPTASQHVQAQTTLKPTAPPRAPVSEYRVLEDRKVSRGPSTTWVRRGDLVSDERGGPGWVDLLRDFDVKMEPV